jgi:hypothetical protein
MLLAALALLLGLLLGALLARSAAERRARASWCAAALQNFTDVPAADLKRLLGGALPPWVRDAEFQKARARSSAFLRFERARVSREP